MAVSVFISMQPVQTRQTIQAIVTNRWTKLTPPYDDVEEDLRQEWSYSVPNAYYMMRKFPGWNGRINFLKYDKVPTGLFRATRKEIESKLGIEFVISSRLEDVAGKPGITSDRAYQNECCSAMLSAIRYGGGLVLNATGSGKTYIAALFCSRLAGPVCFLVDQLDLLEQARAELSDRLKEKIGYVGRGIYEIGRVTVATVQTVHQHIKDPKFKAWLNSLDVIIIDEIHVQMNHRNFKTIAHVQPKAVFGLTATLEMKKKNVRLRAYAIAGPVLYDYPLERGQKEKVLAAGIVTRILYPNRMDLEDAEHERYNTLYTRHIVENPERNSIMSRLVRYAHKQGKFTILLVNRVRHVQLMSKRLHDVPHRVVYGHVDVLDRVSAKKKFEKGKIRVLIANQVFKKGVDIRRVDMIIDGAAMKSRNDAIQKFGRGIRQHAEKQGLLYFDIADQDPWMDAYRKETRDPYIKNSFSDAAKKRKRAFKAAGIQTLDVAWDPDLVSKEILARSEKFLAKLLVQSGRSKVKC